MKLEQLDGKRILHEKGQTIYVDVYTRKGYRLNSGDAKSYLRYENRYLLAVILMMLVLVFTGNPIISLLTLLLSFVAGEIYFYFAFLRNLEEVSYVTRRKGLSEEVAAAMSPGMILVFILFALMVAGGIFYLALHTIYEIVFYILSFIASIFVYIAIVYAIGFYKRWKGDVR